jgi:hypothetical protein
MPRYQIMLTPPADATHPVTGKKVQPHTLPPANAKDTEDDEAAAIARARAALRWERDGTVATVTRRGPRGKRTAAAVVFEAVKDGETIRVTRGGAAT